MKKSHVQSLAYWLWQQRGMPHGSPDDDWFMAEQLIKLRCQKFQLSLNEMPLFAFGIERRTR